MTGMGDHARLESVITMPRNTHVARRRLETPWRSACLEAIAYPRGSTLGRRLECYERLDPSECERRHRGKEDGQAVLALVGCNPNDLAPHQRLLAFSRELHNDFQGRPDGKGLPRFDEGAQAGQRL